MAARGYLTSVGRDIAGLGDLEECHGMDPQE